ncbi:MAG: four helix bundle protein [Pirellulales bacterium]|nr:four helix bundle protein [Pirellulales bacterium]
MTIEEQPDSEKSPPQDIGDRSFAFAVRVINLCKYLDKKPGVNRLIAHQLLRSGTSIGANVEEGKGSQSRADFVSKYSIALKEARETHYWLRLLKECSILEARRIESLICESDQLVRILITIVKKTKDNSK